MTAKYRIFQGANGYYVAMEHADGSHWQPDDNGARIGFDRAEAQRELRRRTSDQASDQASDVEADA